MDRIIISVSIGNGAASGSFTATVAPEDAPVRSVTLQILILLLAVNSLSLFRKNLPVIDGVFYVCIFKSASNISLIVLSFRSTDIFVKFDNLVVVEEELGLSLNFLQRCDNT